MNADEYSKLAERSSAKLESKQMDDAHMFLGMMTELAELADIFKKHIAYGKMIDWVNVEEEIGDLLWYIGVYSRLRSFNLEQFRFTEFKWKPTDRESVLNSNLQLIFAINESFTEIFGYLMTIGSDEEYDRDMFQHLLKWLGTAWGDIEYFCYINNLDIDKIMEKNIEKLKVRYPDKFSEDKAINRNLDTERKILEKGLLI